MRVKCDRCDRVIEEQQRLHAQLAEAREELDAIKKTPLGVWQSRLAEARAEIERLREDNKMTPAQRDLVHAVDAFKGVEADFDLQEQNARLLAMCERLDNALEKTIAVVRTWHGEPAWDIYLKNAPEMGPARAALADFAAFKAGREGK